KSAPLFADIRRTARTPDEAEAHATSVIALPADLSRARAHLARPHGLREDWRRRERRCIRSNRSGISPRCSIRSRSDRVLIRGRKLHCARRTRLQRPTLDQRISPAAQGRDVNVDPILPPVERARIVTKLSAFFGYERVVKFFNVLRHKIVLVKQNERL